MGGNSFYPMGIPTCGNPMGNPMGIPIPTATLSITEILLEWDGNRN